jgi:hypothetical protein
MSGESTDCVGRQVGRCGNCGGWVWSEQEYVEWEGFVPIHSDCWDGNDRSVHTATEHEEGGSE